MSNFSAPASPTGGSTILIAEDEQEVREYLEIAFRCEGYTVDPVEDGQDALDAFYERHDEFGAVVLDLLMPRKDGLATLQEIRSSDKDIPVFMISAAATPINIVESMKAGATDFMPKPLNPENLRRIMAATRSTPAPPRTAAQMRTDGRVRPYFGSTPRMRAIRMAIRQIGESDAPVLIQGETGTGKEVIAREIHANSPRANRPFLKLNCAALPSELVESELFGYERGAFTGAFQRKAGMFELADRGTIFLDEIGDMAFKLQSKLLQVLQDKEFQRLGGKETVHVDVRVIAATHRDLEKAIAAESFREDLYYRLNVINIGLPPLRERRQDVIPLAELFSEKYLDPNEAPVVFSGALREALQAYSWPGNIRELENIVRRFIILRNADSLAAELNAKAMWKQGAAMNAGNTKPPAAAAEHPDSGSILQQVSKAKQQAEAETILKALAATHWNRKRAAAMLDIDYKALLYKMKKLSIGNGSSNQGE